MKSFSAGTGSPTLDEVNLECVGYMFTARGFEVELQVPWLQKHTHWQPGQETSFTVIKHDLIYINAGNLPVMNMHVSNSRPVQQGLNFNFDPYILLGFTEVKYPLHR